AAPDAPVFLVGVPNDVGQAMASWRQDRYASRELNFRRELRLPPAVRTATLSGHREPVQETLAKLKHHFGLQSVFLQPRNECDEIRVLTKFEYKDGDMVTQALREEV